MIYMSQPLVVWGLTLALLQYAHGQRGFDQFFRHFAVLCGVGIIGAVLYRLALTEAGFLIFAGWVGLHSLALFMYAGIGALAKRWRRNTSGDATHRQPAGL